jgi:hypothetical protein
VFARVTIFDDVDLSLEREALAWTSTEGRHVARALSGYQGRMTLVDREGRRLIGIGFYDSPDGARQAERLVKQVTLESVPEELRRALPRQVSGVFEVIDRDGLPESGTDGGTGDRW